MSVISFEKLMTKRKYKSHPTEITLLGHLFKNVKLKNECWEWQGSKDRHGYGQIRLGKLFYVTRIMAWITYQFDIDDPTKFVCHTCDNPKCINPSHLFVGSQKDNHADMMRKKRDNQYRVPTDTDLKIISLLGKKTVNSIANECGVHYYYIVNLKRYYLPRWIKTGTYKK